MQRKNSWVVLINPLHFQKLGRALYFCTELASKFKLFQRLQQQLLQQQQQHLSQQGQTTLGAESSMSSSVEDTKNQSSLKSEVERLLIRVNELETENASLTQKVEQLQMREE